jgi:hypothetical protein
MSNTITIKITRNYGVEAIYPICDTGFKILELTGRKTLLRKDIDTLKSLGYTINIQSQSL